MARIGIIVSAELPPEFTIQKWKEYVLASVKSGLHWRYSDVGASVTVTGTIADHTPQFVPKGPVYTGMNRHPAADEPNYYGDHGDTW